MSFLCHPPLTPVERGKRHSNAAKVDGLKHCVLRRSRPAAVRQCVTSRSGASRMGCYRLSIPEATCFVSGVGRHAIAWDLRGRSAHSDLRLATGALSGGETVPLIVNYPGQVRGDGPKLGVAKFAQRTHRELPSQLDRRQLSTVLHALKFGLNYEADGAWRPSTRWHLSCGMHWAVHLAPGTRRASRYRRQIAGRCDLRRLATASVWKVSSCDSMYIH